MDRPVRILIAEDEIIVALALQSHLEARGYAVVGVVTTGEEAVAEAAALRPDVVLMDIGLDGALDGIEAACRLGAVQSTPPLVIFLTAYADAATKRRAEQADPFGYIVKPFAEGDMLATVGAALARCPVD